MESSAAAQPEVLNQRRYYILSALLLAAAAAWKWLLILWEKFPFTSDEAVVGLMARHILAGAKPVFYYNQSYMGSLDAWLTATGFAVLGQQVWVIRLVQTLLYLAVIATSMSIARRVAGSRRAALVCGLLLAFPVINVTLYTTLTLGGYNEVLLAGNVLILLTLELTQAGTSRQRPKTGLMLFMWGLAAGLGFWSLYLTAVYIAPCFLYLLWYGFFRNRQNRFGLVTAVLLIAAGFFTGTLPVLVYIGQIGLRDFLGDLSALSLPANETGAFQGLAAHARNFALFGLSVITGIRPPWSVKWLALPLIPLNIAAWLLLILQGSKKVRPWQSARRPVLLLCGVGGVLLLAFLFTHFGFDPSGRYLLPFSVLAAMLIGMLFAKRRHWILAMCVGVMLLFNVIATIQCAAEETQGITPQYIPGSTVDHAYDRELIDFLYANGEHYGYSNYWVTYPLAFLTSEEILFVTRLPYAAGRSLENGERYKPYTEIVRQAKRPAYITTRQADLDEVLRAAFTARGVAWQEKTIGDYRVFYRLSQTIHPEDIGPELCTYGTQDYCP